MKTNFTKIYCRACMQVNFVGPVNLNYSKLAEGGKTLFVYFNECTQLQAELSDGLPQNLCPSCAQQLHDAYNFIKKAQQTDRELKKLLTKEKARNEFLRSTNGEQVHIAEFQNDPLTMINEQIVLNEALTMDNDSELDAILSDIKSEGEDHEKENDEDDDCDDENLSVMNNNLKSSVKHDREENDFILENDSDYSIQADEESGSGISRKCRVIQTSCSLCDYKYSTQDKLKDHIFQMHKSHIICLKCPKAYEFPNELLLHEYLVHDTGSPKQCNWCKRAYKTEELPEHLQTRHRDAYAKYFPRIRPRDKNRSDTPISSCECCEKNFRSGLELADHMKECNAYAKYFPRMRLRSTKVENDTSRFRCEYCQKGFSSILELADHTKGCQFVCPLCSKTFKKAGSYRAHIKRIHNRTVSSLKDSLDGNNIEDKPFKCSLCPRQYQRKNMLREHIKSQHKQDLHEDEDETKLYACQYCDKRFKNRASVYRHKSSKHRDAITEKTVDGGGSTIKKGMEENESEYPDFVKCKYCEKEIEGCEIRDHERRHIYAMNSRRKFLCAHCPREFNSQVSVKSHERKIHLGNKPEPKPCPICEKKFDPEYLRKHIQNVHTSERKFICDVCGDPFKSYILLHSHKRLHFERNFPCAVCKKKFIRSCDLKVHMRMHTGEEPFACHICDRRFKMKVRLNYHLQRHAGIKRKCNVCGKEFNHVKQLKIHSYKHTGMPYRCTVCDYGCAQRDVFRNHLLRMHDMMMTADEYCAMFKANTGRFPHVKTLEELQSGAQVVEQEESNSI